MFEFAVEHATFSADEIPAEVLAAFSQEKRNYEAVSLLPWEEHCTECAMPQCYKTCDMYAPRKDGKCRRFQYGFGYIEAIPEQSSQITKIAFKRWGQLMAYATTKLRTYDAALKLERKIARTDNLIARIPDRHINISGRTGISSRLRRRYKQNVAQQVLDDASDTPDAFVVEVFNPNRHPVKLTLTIRDADGALSHIPYQELLDLGSGFSVVRIPFMSIQKHIDATRKFHISICPNLLDSADEGLTLYFGFIGFVKDAAKTSAKANEAYIPGKLGLGEKYIKVVAWDLDNTLWSGILVEDGEEGLVLRDGIIDVIKELDRRGIVNSIVSKNDLDVVWGVLQRLEIDEYFVFPQISWGPKSIAIRELISAFNVASDTIAVIDDSEFERSEMLSQCPDIRAYPETAYLDILEMAAFKPEISEDSAKRREFYRTEALRQSNMAVFGADYLSFLKSCKIKATLSVASELNIARVHELIQRTNQLNYSGNRYSRADVAKLLGDPAIHAICVTCTDRFGDYGLVGFCVVDRLTSTVKDMMFSCRVQSKRVEHALLTEIMKVQQQAGHPVLNFIYKRTPKNTPAAKVFDDLKFQLMRIAEDECTHHFSYELNDGIPEQDIVEVEWGDKE